LGSADFEKKIAVTGKPDGGGSGVRRLWAYGCTDYYQQAAPIIASSPANAKNNILKTAIPLTVTQSVRQGPSRRLR
jgi:hypothetical protein